MHFIYIYDKESFTLPYVESEQNYIAIIDDIFFSFLEVFPLGLHCILAPIFHEIIISHHLSANKSFLKISVNHTCRLRSLCLFTNSPATDFISSSSEEINKI